MRTAVRIFSAIALVAGAISIGGVAVARGESERSVVAMAALQTDALAVDDVSSGNPAGTAVRVDVLANDDPSLVADSVRPLRPSDQARVADFAVPGEGVWLAVAAAPGAPTMIEFIPDAGFTGDPTPQRYSALDANGGEHRATVTITYTATAPPDTEPPGSLAVDDVSSGNPAGSTVRVDVLANDDPSLVADSVRPLRPSDQARVADFAVPGEGVWLAVASSSGATIMIEFIPNVGFTGDPTPQRYSVLDANGGEHRATVTITYAATPPTDPPEALAVDDVSTGNPVGTTVRIDVLANDDPSLLAPSVRLVRPSDQARVLDVTVPGEGAWFIVSLSPSGVSPGEALVDFVPEGGFTGDPTPMRYVVRDPAENDHVATITITYRGGTTTTPTTTTAPTGTGTTGAGTTAQPTGDGLPVTGSQNAGVLVAFALVVGGILLVIGARRRAPDA